MLGRISVVLGLWRCLLAFLYGLSRVGAFSVLAKSDLVKCERVSVGGGIQNCKNKVLTTVTITNESREPAGTLHFTQWNVKCENGSDLQMRFGMNVNLVKGQVWNYYPLQREKLYNRAPFELLLYTSHGDCRDDPRQKDVTCQWAYSKHEASGQNEQVRDSQGFCCSCGDASWFKHHGIKSAYRRGGDQMHCEKPWKWQHKDSASCLRFVSEWYIEFNI